MSSGPVNLYHRRLVKDADAKACWICYKPSSTVLSAPDNSDWFYVCPGHLTDNKFAIPKDAEDLVKKAKDAEIEKEIEEVKKEFAEKMKKKMDRQRIREWEKEGKNVKEEQKKLDEKSEQDLKEEEEKKLKELEKKKEPEKASVTGPRIFELHKNFWNMRQQKKAQAVQAKRQAERLRNPTFFPSVPKGP
ncbi:Putative VPS4-associated protein [Septoria linicola]|uniref:VPS4-associated protein n=1 Tax=Septoria linicola TaxID=215465 RepID=A0A9Q9EQD8_9PEZI|nr:putative VPS4-associated protein [Septoria linicola]USW58664.1 Putative VPS4-associated protein [Septoria linicola]